MGWQLRGRKPLYGLTLQGGGIGILYLTVFAAAKLYQLLPFTLAFGVLLCLVAPALLSTGSGSHVALFSYFLLLNIGIFGIAWFKSWRLLNLLGFVFTYVIGSMWGYNYYQPSYFVSLYLRSRFFLPPFCSMPRSPSFFPCNSRWI